MSDSKLRGVPDPPTTEFRFYEELNDFLPSPLRKQPISYTLSGTPSVKDAIEALGVPHTEIDLILVDGESVDFGWRLRGGERVAVYPMFERLDITPLTRLRAQPLRVPRFVLDAHLGRLARYLRLLGFDALYRSDYDDATLVRLSRDERRAILTRDVGLLKHAAVTHGYWLRATNPRAQVSEVVRAFDLVRGSRPFTRCMDCNALLHRVAKEAIVEMLPPRVREEFDEFVRCPQCGKVYWRGSHYERMQRWLDELGLAANRDTPR